MQPLGENLTARIEGNKVILEFDAGTILRAGPPDAKTGRPKNNIVASSGGFQAIFGLPDNRQVKVNLNVITPVK